MGGPTSLSSSLFSPGNLFNSPSLLSAQDPFYALTQSMGAASGSTSNSTMDLLQKCKLKFDFTNFLFQLSHLHFYIKKHKYCKVYIYYFTNSQMQTRKNGCLHFKVQLHQKNLSCEFYWFPSHNFMYFHVKNPKLYNAC